MRASALWLVMVVLLLSDLCLARLCVARAAADELELALPGISIVRYLPSEGKLVIRYEGGMLVVRQGDGLPGGRGRIVQTSRDRVVISVGAAVRSGASGSFVAPERLVILARSKNGAFEPTVYTGSPEQRSAPVVMALPQVTSGRQPGPMATPDAAPPTPSPEPTK